MKINVNNKSSAPIFGSAADLSIKYAIEKRGNLLPKRVKQEISRILQENNEKLPKLYELHDDIYKPLQKAASLEEVKSLYPEFNDVIELTTLDGNRSKALKAVKKLMPLENFSLDLLKKLYIPKTMEQIVSDYGFTNRSLLSWLIDKLHMKKLDGNYVHLLSMSTEEGNARVAELTRQALKRETPETKAYRAKRAAEGVRTDAYKKYKKEAMKKYYVEHPELREKVRNQSYIAWNLAPELRKEFSEYTLSAPSYTRFVLTKKRTGKSLTDEEKRIYKSFYKGFWQDPRRREMLSKAKVKAAELYKSLGDLVE